MGSRLQRHLGVATELGPGQFTRRVSTGKAAIRCPSCGGVDVLDQDHVIDRAGRVTPAWSCPTETCGFLDWIELESWSEERAA